MISRLLTVLFLAALLVVSFQPAAAGVITANGWYEGEEIYYIDQGVETNVTERGPNQIYLIGGDRALQANVVLDIPGEPGYTPHWNVNVVHTTAGVTVQEILDSGFASNLFYTENVLFDDVEDILAAQEAGLVYIDQPGVVVLCPVISEEGADAPGNMPRSED
ncbi:MAG: hypothetical protein P8074_20990, partial [Anaerolineales bacterium]